MFERNICIYLFVYIHISETIAHCLYRELAARSEEPPLRYVVTDPEDDFEVYSTDLVFALCRRGKV